MQLEDATILSVELTTPQERTIPAYDYTTLTAMNTCPTWGTLRYLHGLSPGTEGSRRPLALELGAACHSAFAAIRLFHLGVVDGYREHMLHHGAKLFGDHWPGILDFMDDKAETDTQRVRNAMMAAFATHGYTDEPWDKRRTISNAEAALYMYLDQWDWNERVWVQNSKQPTSHVGIELLVDFVIRARVSPEYLRAFRVPSAHIDGDILCVRYIGRIDGLHHHGDSLLLQENKTSGKLDDAWEESFSISHQVTGYSIAASLYADVHVSDCAIIGLQIPVPRDTFKTVRRAYAFRAKHNYLRWAQWVLHTLEKVWLYKDTPENAPMYSHSCNRYFRPCSFIPVCYADDEDRAEYIKHMTHDPWTPLRDYESKVGD